MYHMKKGGSSKSSKQQAAIAISMKAAGKKPKMQQGGEPASSYSKFVGPIQRPMQMQPTKKQQADMKKLATPPQKKMGGSLKSVDSSKNPGLAKLPTEVRNKMGYQKYGGSAKMKMGGSCGTPKSLSKKK